MIRSHLSAVKYHHHQHLINHIAWHCFHLGDYLTATKQRHRPSQHNDVTYLSKTSTKPGEVYGTPESFYFISTLVLCRNLFSLIARSIPTTNHHYCTLYYCTTLPVLHSRIKYMFCEQKRLDPTLIKFLSEEV